jgi:two-component system LytT family sensor kinase
MTKRLTPDTETILASSDKPSFWFLHVVGWLSYVVIFSFDNILFTHEMETSFIIIIPLIISGAMAAALTLPLRFVYSRCWQLSPKNLIVTIVLASFVVALLWTPAKNIAVWQFTMDKDLTIWLKGVSQGTSNPWAILTSLSYAFFMILVWSSLYFGINYHYRLMKEKQLHIDAVRLSHRAQIKMLRYQINPHFLFNTLNAISTLVLKEDKEKANSMLARLSTFLRFSLDNDPEKKVPLIEEIKASMLYLEIEKTRFEERLTINMRVEAQAENKLVPSLLLQPLIENSIKYAIAKMATGGIINIIACCENNMLKLCVSDNGPVLVKKPEDIAIDAQSDVSTSYNGVGLNNIQDRLAGLYPMTHTFKISQNQPEGFKVEIAIPMEEA